MKTFLLGSFLCLSLGVASAQLSYQFNSSTGTLTISGTGSTVQMASIGQQIGRPDPLVDNTSLKKVVITANGVTTFEDGVFASCTKLESINIPSTVKNMGYGAFYNCKSLTSLTFPEGITAIKEHTVEGCASLKSFTVPSTVTSIGLSAFEECTGLISLIMGNGVLSIGESAMSNCESLQTFTLPNQLTTISNYLFESCYALKSVVIPESVTSIGGEAFGGCYSLESIVIPSKVKQIGSQAFIGCTALKEATFKTNLLQVIPDLTFNDCKSLERIVIPEGVTEVGQDAFSGCLAVKEILLPSTLTTIKHLAFQHCDNALNIYIDAPTPPTVATEEALEGIDKEKCLLTVPVGSKSAYNNAFVWKDFQVVNEATNPTSTQVVLSDKEIISIFSGELMIKGVPQVRQLTLFDLSGKKVASSNQSILNTRTLVKGIYLIRIESALQPSITRKVIIP